MGFTNETPTGVAVPGYTVVLGFAPKLLSDGLYVPLGREADSMFSEIYGVEWGRQLDWEIPACEQPI
jgi:hypothetical protein